MLPLHLNTNSEGYNCQNVRIPSPMSWLSSGQQNLATRKWHQMTTIEYARICSGSQIIQRGLQMLWDTSRVILWGSSEIFWARGPGLVDLAWSSRRNRTKTSKTITVLEGLIVIVVDYYRVRTCTNTMSIHKHDLDSRFMSLFDISFEFFWGQFGQRIPTQP